MKSLRVQIHSGEFRYIVSLKDSDFVYSIYSTNAVEASINNIKKARDIAKMHKLDNIVYIGE